MFITIPNAPARRYRLDEHTDNDEVFITCTTCNTTSPDIDTMGDANTWATQHNTEHHPT